jgi:hypothetical protein
MIKVNKIKLKLTIIKVNEQSVKEKQKNNEKQ